MLYLQAKTKTNELVHLVILETQNIEEIMRGGSPAVTPMGGHVVIDWTPDPVWLAEQIAKAKGDVQLVAAAILESQKRPQAPLRAPHPPMRQNFDERKESN